MNLIDPLLQWLPGQLTTAARILLVLAMAALALRAIQHFIPHLREIIAARQESTEDSQRIRTLSRVFRYVLTVVVTGVTGLLILGELGIAVAPVLGAAGVVGIAVGFGAQSLVRDCFTGFFLLLENQIRIGDVVEAGGKSGVVEELTLRYLRLRDYGGNVHFVPNGAITTVTNMSLGHAFAVMDVGIGYSADVAKAMAAMRQVAADLRADRGFGPLIDEDLEIAGVDQWAESSLVIRGRLRVKPLQQWSVRREFLRRLKPAFDAEGIDIPYPHLTLIIPGTRI
jgi:small conductance mechanosensitive channel